MSDAAIKAALETVAADLSAEADRALGSRDLQKLQIAVAQAVVADAFKRLAAAVEAAAHE